MKKERVWIFQEISIYISIYIYALTLINLTFPSEPLIILTMASQGVEAMLALRRQLQEKKALLKRQVEQERGRVARLAKSPLNIVPSITHHPM